jgi:tetratricopeptide (TPR) repeat protein
LQQAAAAMAEDRPDAAEPVLSEFLEKYPRDIDALYLMAETQMRLRRFEDAEAQLARCVELAPDLDAARIRYALALHRQGKSGLAAAQLAMLVEKDPRDLSCRDLQSEVLTAMGKHAEALACYRTLVKDRPESGELRIRFGHALRTVGRREESIAVYRSVIASSPVHGDAWWGLASLKVRFTGAEIETMQSLLARRDLTSENRVYLHFALGRAFGDLALWEKSFENYARANAIRRIGVNYDPDSTSERVAAIGRLFTRAFFHERAGSGCDSRGPIFVVGMQRSGSTLLEQILASHSAIEGAGELPDIPLVAARLESRAAAGRDYRVALGTLDAEELGRLGETYRETTCCRRNLGRPFFVDKQPFNFWHVGLIHLILPHAKIIDVRRHPLACCFSNFTTLLSHGQGFSYRLRDLGRYYRDYVELMAHFDTVLPGRVYRVIYDELVADPEKEIRALLGHLGLPFEDACLAFHANTRAMNSVSSEQVRRPIYSGSVDQWRRYETWLGPLKSALGPVMDAWR